MKGCEGGRVLLQGPSAAWLRVWHVDGCKIGNRLFKGKGREGRAMRYMGRSLIRLVWASQRMPSNDLLSGPLFVFILTSTRGHFWSNCSICVLHMRSSGNAQSSKVCSDLLHLLNSLQTEFVHLCFPSEGTELAQQLHIFSTHRFLCRLDTLLPVHAVTCIRYSHRCVFVKSLKF